MQNREQIIQEYFQLRVFLNRANKLADQKSELKFEIETRGKSHELWVRANLPDSQSNGIVLAIQDTGRFWVPSSFFKFEALKDYCCERLNLYMPSRDVKSYGVRLTKDLASLRVE